MLPESDGLLEHADGTKVVLGNTKWFAAAQLQITDDFTAHGVCFITVSSDLVPSKRLLISISS